MPGPVAGDRRVGAHSFGLMSSLIAGPPDASAIGMGAQAVAASGWHPPVSGRDAASPVAADLTLPLLSSSWRITDAFVRSLAGSRAARDGQALPVPTYRPWADSLDWVGLFSAGPPQHENRATFSSIIGQAAPFGARTPEALSSPESNLPPAASMPVVAPAGVLVRSPALSGQSPSRAPVATSTLIGQSAASGQAAASSAAPIVPAAVISLSTASTPAGAVSTSGTSAPPFATGAGPEGAIAASHTAGPLAPSTAAAFGPTFRPGGLGSFTELLGSMIGTRAAGLVTEIIEPQTLVALSAGLLSPAQAAMMAGGTARRALAPLFEQLSGGLSGELPGTPGQRTWTPYGPLPVVAPADAPRGPNTAAIPAGRPSAVASAALAGAAQAGTPSASGDLATPTAASAVPLALVQGAAASANAEVSRESGSFSPIAATTEGSAVPGPGRDVASAAWAFSPLAAAMSSPAWVQSGISRDAVARYAPLLDWLERRVSKSGAREDEIHPALADELSVLPWPVLSLFPAAAQVLRSPALSPSTRWSEAGAPRPVVAPAAPSSPASGAPLHSALALGQQGAARLLQANLSAGATAFSPAAAAFVTGQPLPGPASAAFLSAVTDGSSRFSAQMDRLGTGSLSGAAAAFDYAQPLGLPFLDTGAGPPDPMTSAVRGAFPGSGPSHGVPSMGVLGATQVFGAAAQALRASTGPSEGGRSFGAGSLSLLRAGWQPPAARAALSGTAASDRGVPMWESMAPVRMDVVQDAIREDGFSTLESRPASSRGGEGRNVPPMTVIEGGLSGRVAASSSAATSGPWQKVPEPTLVASSGAPSRAEVEASAKLMEAIRAQASQSGPSAQSSGSTDRITLGDMTLISVAASQQQMAASPIGSAPGNAPEPNHGSAAMAQTAPKKEDEAMQQKKIRVFAKQIFHMIKEMMESENKERFGEQ